MASRNTCDAVRSRSLFQILVAFCLLSATVQAAEQGSIPLAFVQPGGMPPQPPRPALSSSDSARLADRWIALLDTSDPSMAGGALDLLEQAPVPLVEAIAERLARTDALNHLIARAPPALQDKIKNSVAINSARLRGFAAAAVEDEMQSAIASGDVITITALTASAAGYRSVPSGLMDVVLSGLENPGIRGQARDGLMAMVLAHPEDTRHARARMLRWAGAAPNSEIARQNRETGLIALLGMNETLDESILADALGSENLALKRAAIGRLRRPGTVLGAKLKTRVVTLLALEQVYDDWKGLRDILQLGAPQVLNDAYSVIPAASLRQRWPAEITAEWVRHAPDASLASMSRLPLDLYTSVPADTLRTCAVVRYQIAVLDAKAAQKQASLVEFWDTIVKSPHGCRDPLAVELDDYLTKASAVEPLAPIFGRLAREGVYQLADWHTGSAQLERGLAPAAAAHVIANDSGKTRSFITGWIAPDAATLNQAGYWARAVPSEPNAAEIHFRVLQAVRDAPATAYGNAVDVARNDKLESGVREAALLALASGNKIGAQIDLFLDMLFGDTSVAQTSAKLLSSAYDNHQVSRGSYKPRGREFFVDVLTHTSANSDFWDLLARLAKEDPDASALFSDERWTKDPSGTCFVFAANGALAPESALRALNAAADNTGATDRLRACVALLTAPDSAMSFLAHHWTQSQHQDRTDALTMLRPLWEHTLTNDMLRQRIAAVVTTAAADQPWGLTGQASLHWWQQHTASANPAAAATLDAEYRKRRYAGYILAVPVAVAVHLMLWAILLTCYPKSPSIQAIVFWNPKVRKILGAGYIDFVLQYVPLARRRLFAPFAREFLRDICDGSDTARDVHGYFGDSFVQRRAVHGVTEREAPVRITAALHEHRGRVLLQGKSGLGKSRFLRYSLALRAAARKDVIVYLRADQCRRGVETEIERRMQGIGSDDKLLRSMIYSGRIYVYIDGYNEVDLDTQEQITVFVADHPHGNIMVTSQIPLRGLSAIDTFELQPLNHEQIRAFLRSRTTILPEDAPVRADAFEVLAETFLNDVWERHAQEEEIRAMEDVLANPMDLTSVAMLLSQGRLPDLFALESQQLDAVKRRLRAQDMEFRVQGFSKALLEQRVKDQENLEILPFAPEVAELLAAKLAQVRTFSDPGMKTTIQEIRFRHDRIRDFFSHFSMLDMTPEQQASYAADARFAGVFPYLARSMPSTSAELLREHLVSLAAEIEDHRVSDSFVREFSWRQRFAVKDPDWMLGYDAGPTRAADEQFALLTERRTQLDKELVRLREVIATGRRYTRLITTADHAEMLQLGKDVLEALGAQDDTVQSPMGPTLRSPDNFRFVLLALSQRDQIRPFHVELLFARLRHADERVLVIVNSQVAVEPVERQGDVDVRDMLRQLSVPLAVLQSTHLYMLYKNLVDGNPTGGPWAELRGQWSEPVSQANARGAGFATENGRVI